MNVYPVNKSDFRLIRGVRNEVLFQVRDIDRKPVVLPAGDLLIIAVIDPLSTTVLMTRELIPADKGVYQLVLSPAELDTWLSGPLSWSIIRSNVAGSGMLWTDLNYTPSATLIVTEGPLPGPAPTVMADWSSFTAAILDNWYYGTLMIGAAQDGYLNGMHTFRVLMTAFVGTIRVETTRVVEPTALDWELTYQQDYAGLVDVDVLNVQGNFYWLRLAINLVTGALDQVQYNG